MESNELHRLIRKYLQGTASDAERERLLQWYRQDVADDLLWEADDPNEEERVHDRMKDRIWMAVREDAAGRKNNIKKSGLKPLLMYASIAAICLLVLGIAFWRAGDDMGQALVAASSAEQTENRFVLLPDSSRVVLRPGSRLVYKTDFKGATREVMLVGEAYFDINRREHQPFIIHTGKVKTVVLGTAFTIRAAEGEENVQVVVQRGKVRVEQEEQIMAELTANQQIVVQGEKKAPKKQTVSAAVGDTFAWTAQDMQFDAQAFGELTSRLERRYGVEIRFKNPDLAKCPISGRFSGMETLEEVLDILCTARGALYRRAGDMVEIDGAGCL
ncbi:MAG TPA: FecR domain-containing protein [Sphingobacterium sp.]|nr:FecR domain-containing protein [Sphingobacterium sp.]